MNQPRWVEKKEALVAHSRQLAEHGGADGIRDQGLLESALSKPKNVFLYDPNATFPQLAASYAFGISSNHPFIDGNKRAALVISEGFLRFNGLRVIASKADKYSTFIRLAAGEISELELAQWFAAHVELFKP